MENYLPHHWQKNIDLKNYMMMIHKELLDMKLRLKFSIPKNEKISKDKYFYIIDVLKRRNILEEELQSKNSSKNE